MQKRTILVVCLSLMLTGSLAWAATAPAGSAQAFLRPDQVAAGRTIELEIIVVASSDRPITKIGIAIPNGWVLTASPLSSVLGGSARVVGSRLDITYAQPWARGSFDSILLKAKSPAAPGAYTWKVTLNDAGGVPDLPPKRSLTVNVTR